MICGQTNCHPPHQTDSAQCSGGGHRVIFIPSPPSFTCPSCHVCICVNEKKIVTSVNCFCDWVCANVVLCKFASCQFINFCQTSAITLHCAPCSSFRGVEIVSNNISLNVDIRKYWLWLNDLFAYLHLYLNQTSTAPIIRVRLSAVRPHWFTELCLHALHPETLGVKSQTHSDICYLLLDELFYLMLT